MIIRTSGGVSKGGQAKPLLKNERLVRKEKRIVPTLRENWREKKRESPRDKPMLSKTSLGLWNKYL